MPSEQTFSTKFEKELFVLSSLSAVAASASAGAPSSFHPGLWSWALLGALIVALLAVDLFVFARGSRTVSVRSSAAWSAVWLAAAVAFGGALWMLEGSQASSEYLAGYLLERSLSLDNLFVFAILFSYFAVPAAVQPRALSWGIMLSLLLRLGFVLAGAALLERFHITFYAFGLLLVWTAYKLARHDDDGEGVHPDRNPLLRLIGRTVAMSDRYDGRRLTTRQAGRRVATPLVAVLAAIATTDVVFAVDSVPAVFAVTTVPFIVFAANAFAMLGMRALYFLLVGMMGRFVYLSRGLAVILAIIGAKMLLIDVWHPPIWASLAAIVVVLGATAAASLRASAPPAPTAARLPGLAEATANDAAGAEHGRPSGAPAAAGLAASAVGLKRPVSES